MIKAGQIVAITFLDHVESPSAAKAERFIVYGRVIRVCSRAVIVASWAYSARSRRCDSNTTTYTILRSCIQKIEKLSAEKDA
jgi:hypothetical protein